MKFSVKFGLATASVCSLSLFAVLASVASAAVPAQIELKEPEKGGSYAYVDVAPETTFSKHGVPKLISAGDEIVLTHPVLEAGKVAGSLRAVCTAAKTSKSFIVASFQCLGTYVLKDGTIVVETTFSEGANEGAIIGGTGVYAEATGTFTTTEHKGYSTGLLTFGS